MTVPTIARRARSAVRNMIEREHAGSPRRIRARANWQSARPAIGCMACPCTGCSTGVRRFRCSSRRRRARLSPMPTVMAMRILPRRYRRDVRSRAEAGREAVRRQSERGFTAMLRARTRPSSASCWPGASACPVGRRRSPRPDANRSCCGWRAGSRAERKSGLQRLLPRHGRRDVRAAEEWTTDPPAGSGRPSRRSHRHTNVIEFNDIPALEAALAPAMSPASSPSRPSPTSEWCAAAGLS